MRQANFQKICFLSVTWSQGPRVSGSQWSQWSHWRSYHDIYTARISLQPHPGWYRTVLGAHLAIWKITGCNFDEPLPTHIPTSRLEVWLAGACLVSPTSPLHL